MVRPLFVLSLAAMLTMGVAVSGQQTTQKPPPATPPVTRAAPATAKPATPATAKPATPATAKPASASPKPATDVRLRTSYTHGAEVSKNVTYLQGSRQRVEFPGVVSIDQCDLKRTIILNASAKRYRTMPYAEPGTQAVSSGSADSAVAGASVAQTPARGGVITMTTSLTDTLERQQMFGLEARRVKTVIVRQPSSTACDKTALKVEIDAWYVDLPEQTTCARPPAAAPPPTPDAASCTDRVEARTAGDVRLGFPVKMTTTTTTGEGNKAEVISSSQEVTELEVTRLDRALFEIPSAYVEASSTAEIVPALGRGGLADALMGSTADGTSSAAPKKPGTIRIGVLEPVNSTERDLAPGSLRQELVSRFNKAPYEALAVAGSSPATIAQDAVRLGCDYLLLVEITEAKTSKASKIGGMMQKVSGEGAKDNYDVKLDYKLFAVGSPQTPQVSGNAKGSNGGFGVGSALRLAAFAGQMYLTMGMMGGMGMNGMMGMSGGAPGSMGGGLFDPRASAMSSMATGFGGGVPGMGGAVDPSEQKMQETVNEALGNAAKATMEQLGRKK